MPTPLRYIMIGGGPDSFMGPVHRRCIGLASSEAPTHAAALTSSTELVGGVFSRSPEKSAALAEKLRLDRAAALLDLNSLEAALPELKPDFAVVITPTPDHYEPVSRLLKAGIPVVCDKPLTGSPAEAEEIVRLSESLDVPVMVTYTYSGYAMVAEARSRVLSGELGRIRMVTAEYCQDSLARKPPEKPGEPRAWRYDTSRAAAFCVEDIGVHLEHLIRHITGQRPCSVSARLQHFTPGLALEDNAFIWATLDGGVEVSAICSKICVGRHNRICVNVVGDKGALEWSHETHERLRLFPVNQPEITLRRGGPGLCAAAQARSLVPMEHPQGYAEAFAALYTDFFADLKARRQGAAPKEKPYPTARDGLLGVRFAHACLASNRGNSEVIQI